MTGSRRHQRGAVLILVLWITSLLTIMLAAFSMTVRIDRQVAGDMLQQVRAQAAADSVLNYLAAVRQVDPDRWESMPGEVFRLPWEGLDVHFRLIPETAFVSLNTAPEDMLEAVFAGLESADARSLAAAVVRRREGDLEAAEDIDRQPRPWISVDELLLLGDGLERVAGLHRFFTVHGSHVEVDARFAAEPLLDLLGGTDYLQESQEDAALTTDAFRIQIELGQGVRRRRLEVSARFVADGVGYQVLHTNLYNVSFTLD
ncbi:hypothetical protein [Halopseudomonas salegens]|uniref:General secretion pathway protein K n=1 Tax=Halopseudomonas salegens TaxID=1434072 RepID=A0A1H2HWN5_9GAMM|nr:hypothetical protein [Halopseudomonas salegens]SDU36145.1 hypothetical protein SAMN05216210_3362 [Halopseudomonas salegens]